MITEPPNYSLNISFISAHICLRKLDKIAALPNLTNHTISSRLFINDVIVYERCTQVNIHDPDYKLLHWRVYYSMYSDSDLLNNSICCIWHIWKTKMDLAGAEDRLYCDVVDVCQ